MSIPSPNLDDRTFAELVEAAKLRIRQQCPEWNDLSPGDPGTVLLEAFAFLTETMIFRLNRIPEKTYIEFLRLIGVKLNPPSAAQVTLQFSLSKPQTRAVEIPRSTRITTANSASGADAPIFSLVGEAVIPAGASTVTMSAYHCETVEAELLGTGTGLPGLMLAVKRAPIIAPTPDKLDLVIGIETPAEELDAHAAAIKYQDKTFRIWREAANFSQSGDSKFVYLADRHTGTITFAPALRKTDAEGMLQSAVDALAEIPPAGSEIRAWYRHGGGSDGNVSAGMLTVLKDPVAGISVTNPEPATGGRDSETLQNALLRGPQDLHSLSRAVTARDFELIAIQSSGAVNRAKAFTQARLWTHAAPGTVEVTLVPEINAKPGQLRQVTAENLQNHHTEPIREQIQSALDSRRPLGTHCVVKWADYKEVSIRAKVVIRREEDTKQVERRILHELRRNICPVSFADAGGSPWPFGQSLKAWDVYKIIGTEPAVLSVEAMKMIVDQIPETGIAALCADAFQPDTWYTGCDERAFRSTNNGFSWELIARFEGEVIDHIKSFPLEACTAIRHAGLVAAITRTADHISAVQVSRDCGQTWSRIQQIQFRIEDFAWLDQDGLPYLLLATEKGIFQLSLDEDAVPMPVQVDKKLPELGFRAIAVSASTGRQTFVAAAAYENKGVYLSAESAKSNSFHNIGLAGELIEVLATQHSGPHRYIWAGLAAPGSDQGKGCFRWTLSESIVNPEGWKPYFGNWQAGGCKALAFLGATVLAASYRLGVLRLNSDRKDAAWESLSASSCGLPLRDVGKLETIDALAANTAANIIMAGSTSGVFLSSDGGSRYSRCSNKEYREEVGIPPNWLIYSGDHQIEIISDYETAGN